LFQNGNGLGDEGGGKAGFDSLNGRRDGAFGYGLQ
jgi:hypothetical protein